MLCICVFYVSDCLYGEKVWDCGSRFVCVCVGVRVPIIIILF